MRIAIAGAAGRMGRALIEGILASRDLQLGAALEAPGHAQLGKDAGEALGMPCGVKIGADVAAAVSAADCIIDFTRPEATLANVAACVAAGKRAVIGTTGFTPAQKAGITAAAERVPIAMAPNFAVGV